jgi:hypothetical protein
MALSKSIKLNKNKTRAKKKIGKREEELDRESLTLYPK